MYYLFQQMTNYEKVAAWRKANPDKVAAQARRYRAKHPDKIHVIKQRHRMNNLEEIRATDRAAQEKRRKADPEGQKVRYARWRSKREGELTAIAGRSRPALCEICHEFNLRIVFDHCHASGEFRGWLCDRCNRVLGTVKDSPELLMALRDYLKGARNVQDESEDSKRSA